MLKKLLPFIFLFLTACATPTARDLFMLGQDNFAKQNYGLAFEQLHPAAIKGNAEAQYAIGYLYYYGYGTPKNLDLARGWIGKSAAQGYNPAIKAVAMMQNKIWVSKKVKK